MKKLTTYSIVFTMLIPLLGFAQPSRYVKLGLNHSSFRTEEEKSELAFVRDNDSFSIQPLGGLFGVFTVQSIQSHTLYKERPQKEFTVIDKVLSVCTGVLFGGLAGGIIGGLIGDSQAYNGKFTDVARGVLIGASIAPFLNYEYWAGNKGVRYPLNTWYAVFGSNTTFSNYEVVSLRLGYSLGIGRNYHLSNRAYLQSEAIFNKRRFFLPSQRIRYNTFATNQLWHSDIDFSVAYVDVALLTKVRVFTFDKAGLSLALGPAMSVQILEKTHYNIRQRENVVSGTLVEHDFGYIDDEPGATSPFAGLVTAIEFEAGKLLLKASLNRALFASNQIFPLVNETQLHTLTFLVGYRFSKQ